VIYTLAVPACRVPDIYNSSHFKSGIATNQPTTPITKTIPNTNPNLSANPNSNSRAIKTDFDE